MNLRKRQLTLGQKVFVVQNYYRLNEDMSQVRVEFHKNFEVKTPRSVLKIFGQLVDTFENSGSVAQPVYFEPAADLDDEEGGKKVPKLKIKLSESPPQLAKEYHINLDEMQWEDQGFLDLEPIFDEQLMETIEREMEQDWVAIDFGPESLTQILTNLPEIASDPEENGTMSSVSESENDFDLDEVVTSPNKTDDTEEDSSDFECAICGKNFEVKSYLVRHMKTHKIDDDDFLHSCQICGRGFKSATNLKVHTLTHIPIAERPKFQCEICGKKVQGKAGYKKHKLSHAEKKDFVCEWCGKGFPKALRLRLHIRTHTGERPFQCNFCEKSFASSSSLTIHRRIHTGERPFKCHYCDKRFIDCSTRTVHHRQHTGENPYVCHICGKSCKQPQNLRSHIRHVHTKKENTESK